MSEQLTEVAVTQLPEVKREVTRFDISGDISSKLANLISSVLRTDTAGKPVHIDMCSHGGDVNAGRVITEILHSQNVPVTFFCGSYNYSMASMLIQAKDFVRLCYPGSRFMFHRTSYVFEGCKDEIAELRRWAEDADDHNREVIKEGIGLTQKEANKKLGGEDRYYLAKEMLSMGEHGAIDGIIQTRIRDHVYLCETRDGLKVIDTYIHRRDDIKNLPVWVKPE